MHLTLTSFAGPWPYTFPLLVLPNTLPLLLLQGGAGQHGAGLHDAS
jgi:hypothetical protein